MIPRFSQFPKALAERAQTATLGGVPALLAHPDWERPAPTVIWLHGRTVNKELDPGRYLRWVRAGIAACALDLPGHGERLDEAMQSPERSLDLLAGMIGEIDGVVAALGAAEYRGVFDASRMAIGGMSAGGMATLRRLCDPHPFVAAAVEGTTGWLAGLYLPERGGEGATRAAWAVRHDPARIAGVDPMEHLAGWRAIPLLALHNEGDSVVPIAGQRRFLEALGGHYRAQGADPGLIELRTFSETGAPQEHAGFGRFGNDAKNAQVEFLVRALRPEAPPTLS